MIGSIVFGVAIAFIYSMASIVLKIRGGLVEKGFTIFECTPCSFFWLTPLIYLYSLLPFIFLFPFYMAAIVLVGGYLIDRFKI